MLPFADGGVAGWNVPFGSKVYLPGPVQAAFGANNPAEASNDAPYSNATQATQHQSNVPVIYGDAAWTACPVANVPVNGPPNKECGGDVGGVVLPVANVGNSPTQALQ